MPTTTKVVSSNPVHGEVYSVPHYVIKFVSDLQQVGGFLLISSNNKAEILLKMALNILTQRKKYTTNI